MPTLKTTDYFGRDGLPSSIVRKEPEERFAVHAHEFSEVVIVFAGRALHVTGDEPWPVAASHVFVVAFSEVHEQRETIDPCLVNILFLPGGVRLEPIELLDFSGYHGEAVKASEAP